MNKISSCFLITLFLATSLHAQAPVPSGPREAIVKDYQEAFQQYSSWVKHISEESFYKDVKMREVNTSNKVIGFVDLTPLQKNLFYLWQSEVCSGKMLKLLAQWEEEYKSLPLPLPPVNADLPVEGNEDPNRVANRNDVLEYGKKLLELRKTHAVNFEKLISTVFKKYEKELPVKDREAYIKRIHNWNINQKLVEDKK